MTIEQTKNESLPVMPEIMQSVMEKYREIYEEIEAYIREHNEEPASYTPEHINILVDKWLLPKEIGDWFFKDIEEKYKRNKEVQKFSKNNPHLLQEDCDKQFCKEGPFSLEETAKMQDDLAINEQLIMFLLKNKKQIDEFNQISDTDTTEKKAISLFNDIDLTEEFGIANCISNSLYHLSELLKNMTLSNIYETVYEAKGCVTNSNGEAINLTYSFQASTPEEAAKTLKEYNSLMISKGLKIWMAHWLMANKVGQLEYSCQMIDIMKINSDEDREAFFSVKEKEEHWAITKLLGASKLSRERKVQKNKKKEMIQWVEQPLVEILGGEKEMSNADKYPTLIAVRVLMPRVDKKGFAPARYKNKTLQVSPSDAYLAFFLQSRAAQRGRGSRDIFVDWDFIFEAGNLQKTALTNTRGAKAKARNKMDRLKENAIIEKWDEELMGVSVTPKKQGTKKKSESNDEST